jgi:hypothetical protein
MPIKLKKTFKNLYFFFNDAIIKIQFDNPIDYNKYYALTKIVSHSLLDFQTAEYLDSFSNDFIKIINEVEGKDESLIFYEIYISFDILKKMLLNIKNDLKLFYKNNMIKFVHIPKCDSINNHIETLANSNDYSKKMSIRQLNSSNNRKLVKLKEKLDNNISIVTTKDAIDYFYNRIISLSELIKK